jgi:hypothetical protein
MNTHTPNHVDGRDRRSFHDARVDSDGERRVDRIDKMPNDLDPPLPSQVSDLKSRVLLLPCMQGMNRTSLDVAPDYRFRNSTRVQESMVRPDGAR